MADTDLSKIDGLIMENPKLIEEIKKLGQEKEKKEDVKESVETVSDAEIQETIAVPASVEKNAGASKRKNLLYALKPYVSKERQRAIESMISFSDILDVFKER